MEKRLDGGCFRSEDLLGDIVPYPSPETDTVEQILGGAQVKTFTVSVL